MRSEYLVIFDVQERNWEWFRRNYSRLVKRFDGEYVAVFDRRIVDHDKNLSLLASRVREKFPFDHVLSITAEIWSLYFFIYQAMPAAIDSIGL